MLFKHFCKQLSRNRVYFLSFTSSRLYKTYAINQLSLISDNLPLPKNTLGLVCEITLMITFSSMKCV